MKLYLASYKFGKKPMELLSDLAENNRVGVILNAMDCFAHQHTSILESDSFDLRSLGLDPVELNLRHYFNRQEDLRRELEKFSYVWVVGGNTFILRRAFALSGFDQILLERAEDSTFTYAGYSAGACIMTPTLRGVELADNPNEIPEGYSAEIIWNALNLYPNCIVPHYKSADEQYSKLMDQSVQYYINNKIPFIALRDGEAISHETGSSKAEGIALLEQ